MDMTGIDKKYNAGVTLKKAAIPAILVAIVEAAAAALPTMGIEIDKAVLYQVAVLGYAALIGFINWLKNRKKK